MAAEGWRWGVAVRAALSSASWSRWRRSGGGLRPLRDLRSCSPLATMAEMADLGIPGPSAGASCCMAAAPLPSAGAGAACGASLPTAASCARASSRSLMRRAMMRQAASCWYRACDSSCLVRSRCCFRVNVSRTSSSYSFWNMVRRPGMEAAVTGRGRAVGCTLSVTSSSLASSSPEMGSLPSSSTYFSMRRFSNTAPERGLATGCSHG
mmetsp:Transcript_3483/g.12026  ORF Transcript_3483/g.12026 Transcript_3483/m.12026 type:complete len:209 (-) Transcript_3483:77-703(-)